MTEIEEANHWRDASDRGQPLNIVCGVDDSREARTAFRAGVRIAERSSARIVLVHVAPHGTVPGAAAAPGIKKTLWRSDTDTGQRLLAALLAEERPMIEVSTRVIFGAPAIELIELAAAENADLVVVGSRGRGTLSGVLLGSVSRDVLRHAPCPVLVAGPSVR